MTSARMAAFTLTWLAAPPCQRQTVPPGIAFALHCLPVCFETAVHCTDMALVMRLTVVQPVSARRLRSFAQAPGHAPRCHSSPYTVLRTHRPRATSPSSCRRSPCTTSTVQVRRTCSPASPTANRRPAEHRRRPGPVASCRRLGRRLVRRRRPDLRVPRDRRARE